MKLPYKIFFTTYCIMIPVIFVLPFFSLPGYSIVEHTTSQLGAQHTPNSWIMNITFFFLGLSSILAGWKKFKKYPLHLILLLGFGVSLALTGIFSLQPIDSSISFDPLADQLHSVFASSTGFAFSFLAISTGFIEKNNSRILAFCAGVLSIALSLLFFQLPEFAGIWQRGIFILCIGWMVYNFRFPLKDD